MQWTIRDRRQFLWRLPQGRDGAMPALPRCRDPRRPGRPKRVRGACGSAMSRTTSSAALSSRRPRKGGWDEPGPGVSRSVAGGGALGSQRSRRAGSTAHDAGDVSAIGLTRPAPDHAVYSPTTTTSGPRCRSAGAVHPINPRHHLLLSAYPLALPIPHRVRAGIFCSGNQNSPRECAGDLFDGSR